MHRPARLAVPLALLFVVSLAPVSAAEPVPTDPGAHASGTPPVGTPAASPSATASASPPPSEAPTLSDAPEPPPSEPAASPASSAAPTPSVEPGPATAAPEAQPATAPPTPEPTPTVGPRPRGGRENGGLDATGRYIVILESAADVAGDTAALTRRHGGRAERTFRRLGGFAAKLSAAERRALERDPAVRAVVPDEIVELAAQSVPTGVSRVFGRTSSIAAIDGVDTRVDADVAVVDTGIDATHPDLNVVGGYDCSTSDRTRWRDVQGHGTHVAGTIAAKDNDIGVVGVAPGARLWAVKILNDEGFGYLSWYVCGLDWIAAQRDPTDASRPLIEAVNMSVAKSGRDDVACGTTNDDILHAAICRLVASGVTVVAAAANDSGSAAARVPAAYNEVITVSALADTDGKPGGLGGNRCYSWGTYDQDDTFADFSNYGYDVDVIAPGKCIWSTLPGNRYGYSSGTSMAAPHVTGAAALYKASRPAATPAEVRSAIRYLGNQGWKTWTDPDGTHEPLLDVSRLGPLGTFNVSVGTPTVTFGEAGGTTTVPVTVGRTSTYFERVYLSASVPAPLRASLSVAMLHGWTGTSAKLTVTVPPATPAGRYTIIVRGSYWGVTRTGSATLVVENDPPKAFAPVAVGAPSTTAYTTSMRTRVTWPAATDASSAIAGYELQTSIDGRSFGGTVSFGATTRVWWRTLATGHSYRFRVRARDAAGNWSAWVSSGLFRLRYVQDSSSALRYGGTWYRQSSSSFLGGTSRYSTRRGSSVSYTFKARAIAVVMPKGPTRGRARIYVDGVLVKTVNTYRSSTLSRQVVYSRAWNASGTHTVRVVVDGTGRNWRIDLDSFALLW